MPTSYAVSRLVEDFEASDLSVSADGKLLAVAGAFRKLRIYDADALTLVKEVAVPPFTYRATFSPDGAWLVSGAKTLNFFSTSTWKKGASMAGQGDLVGPVMFAPKGERLYSASAKGTVREWDVRSRKQLRCWQAKNPVKCLALSSDSKLLAWAEESHSESCRLTLADLANGSVRWTLDIAEASHLEFAPRNGLLLVSSPYESLLVFDAKTGAEVRFFDSSVAFGFTVASDGTVFYGGLLVKPPGEIEDAAGRLDVFDVSTGKRLSTSGELGFSIGTFRRCPRGERLYCLGFRDGTKVLAVLEPRDPRRSRTRSPRASGRKRPSP